jgi:uncharacterized protein YbbC (DUF1343 family)
MDSVILMMAIRVIGLEIFLPCTSFLSIRFAMKFSNANFVIFKVLKYSKDLFLKSILVFFIASCGILSPKKNKDKSKDAQIIEANKDLHADDIKAEEELYELMKKPILGIDRLHLFVDSLQGKRIAVVGNNTSMVDSVHLVDTLLRLKLDIVKIFAPEHGFRGNADAGEHIKSSVDSLTQIPLISLYGLNKKPSREQLEDVDIVLYDIQDVGVRFYTYISTLHYVMEACAEYNKQLVVLDRPNPNGHYIDGPVLEPAYKSFVGMHPVPIVYGMTIGEYAMMINGEKWLKDSLSCQLWVVPCKYYTHKSKYVIPYAPSPNLRTEQAITFYPSLCIFEATTVSVGRGTDFPFEVFGHPRFPDSTFNFTPKPMKGAKHPMYENQRCNGFRLTLNKPRRSYELNLNYLLTAKELLGDSNIFVNQPKFFHMLAGTNTLLEQINAGWNAKEIRATWKPGLDQFKAIRQKYLLYR